MTLPELWNEYKLRRESRVKQKLIESYLPLVVAVASRMSMKCSHVADYDDLVGWGTIGLIESIDRFDIGKGVKFETYARVRIKGAILDGLREMDWITRSARQQGRRLKSAYAALERRLGRPATDQEVAEELGIDPEKLNHLIASASQGAILSLDEMIQVSGKGDSASLLDAIPDPESPDPLVECEIEDMKNRLAQAIDGLPERERLVITLHYYDDLMVKEIAGLLGVSEGRVSQLHTRAILRLRARLAPEADHGRRDDVCSTNRHSECGR